jgi:hypothetical protein
MIFHKLETSTLSSLERGSLQIEAGKTSAKKLEHAAVNVGALVWSGGLTGFFAIAAIVSHSQGFSEGETVFLNLTVALLSASTGAFLGERLTIGELTHS